MSTGGFWARLLSYRPSAAMVVALIALFVAMGGTTYAVKRLPKRSVGAAQLKKDAVVSSKDDAPARLSASRSDTPSSAAGPPCSTVSAAVTTTTTSACTAAG